MSSEQTHEQVSPDIVSPDGRVEEVTKDGANGSRVPVYERQQGGLAVFRVLRHREFALFWAGQSISMTGSWMQAFAQGWVVATLTSSAFALGLANFAMSLPTLVLMPFGGVAADRIERRRILLYTQWALLVLAAVMGTLVAGGRLQLWHVYLLALPLGVATAYEMPAYQSFYPQLIEREELPQAISLNQATFHGARILGPALASAVVAVGGMAAAFYANAASFLAVIVALSLIRPRPPATSGRGGSTLSFMAEGMRYLRERPQLQALLGLTGITTLFIFPNLAVLTPFYARYVLHVGPGGLGLMMSVSGAGSLLGAALILTVPRELRVPIITACSGVILCTMSALAWSHRLELSVAVMTIQSLAISHSLGLGSVMVQEFVPDELRGRVMSLHALMFTGIMPFAALLIPKAADLFGMRWELQGAAILYAAGAAVLLGLLHRAPPADAVGYGNASRSKQDVGS